MQKAFHWDSPSDPYVADAVVLTCFDQRIRTAVNKFLHRRGIFAQHVEARPIGGRTGSFYPLARARGLDTPDVQSAIRIAAPGPTRHAIALDAVSR